MTQLMRISSPIHADVQLGDSPLQMHHEDFEHEIQLSLVDTAEVEEDRNTLQDTWDIHK